MPPNALAQDHHARAVGGRVDREVQGYDPAGECVRQERDPGTPQETSGLGTNGPHVGLRVIDVGNLEGPVSVARRALLQLPVERLLLISSPAALPFECLFSAS